MRFSDEFKLPPAVEELLQTGGPAALQALLASARSPSKGGARHAAARRADDASDSGSGSSWSGEDSDGSDSSGWLTDDGSDAEAQAQAICMATGDFRRAFEAFAAKRKPVFEGN